MKQDMKKRVLVTYNMFREGYAEMMERCDVTFPPDGVETFTYEEVLAVIDRYDALLSMFNFPVDRKLMERGTKLRIVSNYAVGFENIDIPTATELGIQVTNTPDPVTEPTADQALGLLLAVCRRIAEIDRKVRIPGALKWGLLENLGHSLYGKTVGIVGMGRIGRALARRVRACGMQVVYHNRHRLSAEEEARYGARYLSLDDLLACSDVVSLNAPHTPETYHLIGAPELQRMKRSAYLINTARGPLVDEMALIAALRAGDIAGAGLDVFEFGDVISPELKELDNVVLNPHTGTQTYEVRNEMAAYAARNILNFFDGKGPVARVNELG